jgi:ribosome biogenesis GTPase A
VLGLAGSGKSATINTMLGREARLNIAQSQLPPLMSLRDSTDR